MTCRIVQRRRGATTELHLTTTPSPGRSVFVETADALREHGARILLERVFAQADDPAGLSRERAAAYRELEDGVPPTWLASPEGRDGAVAAVQVYAVSGGTPPVAVGGHARVLRDPEAGLVTVSALAAPQPGGVADQCAAVFNDLPIVLERAGTSLMRAARTWVWIDPIHRFYRDLNQARNRCFVERGLIGPDRRPVHLPASTGIGLRPLAGNIALEAIAPLGGPGPRPLSAAGNQECALGYGSAFSRAASLLTPGGETHFVSGTAAIDAAGETVAVGDAEGQVVSTIENVRAVLRDLSADEKDIAQGVAYCVDPEVVEVWRRRDPGWPLAVVLADICRDNLLFEIEVTACPGGTSLS
jgi:enamine deaminase RidA (YjgF/YER057c/UK114 family)